MVSHVKDPVQIPVTPLIGKEIAVINYLSNGKYKKQIWQKVGSVNDTESLQAEFEKSVEAGYPKDFVGYTTKTEEVDDLKSAMQNAVKGNADGLPF